MKKESEERKENTKDKIIKVTLEIINEEGLNAVTIRKIAALANVNVAAVNYHFGSKYKVIEEALSYLSQKFGSSFHYLRELDQSPTDRLKNFLTSYMETAISYPDIIKNFISKSMDSNPLNKEYSGFVKKEGLQLIRDTIMEIRGVGDSQLILMHAFQMMSSLTLPVILGQTTGDILGLHFEEKEVRDRYIDMLVNNIVK